MKYHILLGLVPNPPILGGGIMVYIGKELIAFGGGYPLMLLPIMLLGIMLLPIMLLPIMLLGMM